MVLSGRPVSSPGRPETYAPIFMRFLRSNVGSKSRGRSRSSPIFVRKKSQATEGQEPSSPKVTCMGQVRIGRSKKPPSVTVRAGSSRRCRWVRNALFCHPFGGKLKPKSFRRELRKWVSFSRVSIRRRPESRGHSTRSEPIFGDSVPEGVRKSIGDEDEEEEEKQGAERNPIYPISSGSTTPPRNALLLTRSRSAPYRSSSLAHRFWGSPISGEEPTRETTHPEGREEHTQFSKCQKESVSGCSDHASAIIDAESEKTGSPSEESEGASKENIAKSANTEVLGSGLPTKLTRCKSEPARTSGKLVPEMGFPRQRRYGFT